MDEDCLKLTTYFGERDRTQDGLLADELLDIYGATVFRPASCCAASRASAGSITPYRSFALTFGGPPAWWSVAVDRRERIESNARADPAD